MFEAARCGVPRLSAALQARTERALASAGSVEGLGEALRILLRLFRYDPLWRATGRGDVADLVVAAFGRVAELLERLPHRTDGPSLSPVVRSIRIAVDTVERCPELPLAREAWERALHTLARDPEQAAELRGAATGARWLTSQVGDHELAAFVGLVNAPEQLGPFVAGVLSVAREAATRRGEFVEALDRFLGEASEADFLAALPGLRRAFSAYPPRERAGIARRLLGEQHEDALLPFAGTAADAVHVAEFEERLAALVHDFVGEGAW